MYVATLLAVIQVILVLVAMKQQNFPLLAKMEDEHMRKFKKNDTVFVPSLK